MSFHFILLEFYSNLLKCGLSEGNCEIAIQKYIDFCKEHYLLLSKPPTGNLHPKMFSILKWFSFNSKWNEKKLFYRKTTNLVVH